jgi:erythromycin esterase
MSRPRILPAIKYLMSAISCLTTLYHNAQAQTFANLDFEYGVYKSQPRKWSIEGEGESYTAALDSMVSHHGRKSLRTALKKANIFIFMAIPGQQIAGKTVEVKAFYKAGSGPVNAILLFYSPIDRKSIPSAAADSTQKDWQTLSHKATFPANYSSDRLLLALTADGTGEFWLDDVQITIDGQLYGNAAPDFHEPSLADIKALNKEVIPIDGIDLHRGMSSLKPFSRLIAGNTLIALGENSHGSATILKLKLNLIKYLVEQHHYTVFALEMPTVEADYINDYVQSGHGSQADAMKNLSYAAWQTREMLDIVDWIKSYNATHPKKVAFRGFDMQNGVAALQEVKKFAQLGDQRLSDKVAALEQQYGLSGKKAEGWETIDRQAKEIAMYLATANYPTFSPERIATIRHYMDVFRQSVALKLNSPQSKSRDLYMAENVDWIVNHSGPGARIMISADNTHITKESGKMGAPLSELYGKKYLAVGFTYNRGTYTAEGKDKYYEVHPSYPGTYEYLFSKSRSKNFILDIRGSQKRPFLSDRAGFRSIGSRPQETTQFAEINLANHFDIIVYSDHSEHTMPL